MQVPKKVIGQKEGLYMKPTKWYALVVLKNLRKSFLNDFSKHTPTALQRFKSKMSKWILIKTLKSPNWIFRHLLIKSFKKSFKKKGKKVVERTTKFLTGTRKLFKIVISMIERK